MKLPSSSKKESFTPLDSSSATIFFAPFSPPTWKKTHNNIIKSRHYQMIQVWACMDLTSFLCYLHLPVPQFPTSDVFLCQTLEVAWSRDLPYVLVSVKSATHTEGTTITIIGLGQQQTFCFPAKGRSLVLLPTGNYNCLVKTQTTEVHIYIQCAIAPFVIKYRHFQNLLKPCSPCYIVALSTAFSIYCVGTLICVSKFTCFTRTRWSNRFLNPFPIHKVHYLQYPFLPVKTLLTLTMSKF